MSKVIGSRKTFYTVILALVMFTNIPLNPAIQSDFSRLASLQEVTTLVHDVTGEPASLDPATTLAYTGEAWRVIQNIYDTLISYSGESTEVVPCLAESWNISEDGKTYTFHLRRDVKFSIGNPCNASAVKYSLDRVIRMNEAPSWILSQVINESSTQILDEYTVQVDLKFPFPAFLSILACPVASIVDPIYVETPGNPPMKDNPMGTGPYKLVEWIKHQKIVLEKNELYWGGWAGKHVDRIEICFIRTPNDKVWRIQKGESDYASIPPDKLGEVIGYPGIISEAGKPTFIISYVAMNCKPNVGLPGQEKFNPLSILKVRQAVSYAIDYNAIIQHVVRNYGWRFQGPIPKEIFGYNESILPYERNLTKARELLAEADYPDGFETRLIYPEGDPTWRDIVQYIKNQLAEIGITVWLDMLADPVWIARLKNGYEPMGTVAWMPDYIDPDNYAHPFLHSSQIGTANFAFLQNATLDELISQAKQESNLSLREKLYSEIQELTKELAPYLWLYQALTLGVRRDRLEGYVYNPARYGPQYYLFHKLYTPDYASLTLTASPPNLVADGYSTSTITATFLNITEAPISGASINFVIERGSGKLSTNTCTTDSYGKASVIYTAGLIHGKVIINASINRVWNTTELILTQREPANLSVKVPSTVHINSSSIIVVTVLDEYNRTISGIIVNFSLEFSIGGSLNATTSITDDTGKVMITYYSPPIVGYELINISAGKIWKLLNITIVLYPPDISIIAPEGMPPGGLVFDKKEILINTNQTFKLRLYNLNYSVSTSITIFVNVTDDTGTTTLELEETEDYTVTAPNQIQILISQGNYTEIVTKPYRFKGLGKAKVSVFISPELDANLENNLPQSYEFELLVSDISILGQGGLIAPLGNVWSEEGYQLVIRLYNLNHSAPAYVKIYVNITDGRGVSTLKLVESANYTLIDNYTVFVTINTNEYQDVVTESYIFVGTNANISLTIEPDYDTNYENNGPRYWELVIVAKPLPTRHIVLAVIVICVIVVIAIIGKLLLKRRW
ncbi:MAG: ABC transporter substrate-binding protein [Candidatus Thermoplasmatota archaeon]|nr:ABC transporter substrate-binding protein [Candidatus Thermoplasmatota archaeon]